jgi:hypothetical protein
MTISLNPVMFRAFILAGSENSCIRKRLNVFQGNLLQASKEFNNGVETKKRGSPKLC